MSKIALALGGFFIVAGLGVALVPESILGAVDWASRTGLTVAAAGRVTLGVLLLIAAPDTRYPTVLRVFGGLTLLVGLLLPFLPLEIWTSLIGVVVEKGLTPYRFVGCIVAVLMGALLIHAARVETSEP